MRSCEEMELLINLCLDDMLPSDDMETLRKHLEECADCRGRFAQLREMKVALGELEEPVPADLHDRIMTYVSENTMQKEDESSKQEKILRPRRWYRGLATIAACAVIAVAAARFVPDVIPNASETADNAVVNDGMMQAMPESMPDPGFAGDVVTKHETPDSNKPLSPNTSQGVESSTQPSPPMMENPTGQLAEDLPPLRPQEAEPDNKEVASIRKWLKAQGPQEKLPQWVDESGIYETVLNGEPVVYVEFSYWAEDYWTEQLLACGFSVEEMEGEDLTEEGQYILLFFYWTDPA